MIIHPSWIMSPNSSFIIDWKVVGGITHAEKHYHGFEESSRNCEGGFPLVGWFHTYIIVSPSDVHLGEDLGVL